MSTYKNDLFSFFCWLLSVGELKWPCPWVNYRDLPYAGLPNEAEIEYAFKSLDDFITQNKEQSNTGIALVFAWNEFEEGGYICPTLKEDGTADESLVKAFAKAKKKYIE